MNVTGIKNAVLLGTLIATLAVMSACGSDDEGAATGDGGGGNIAFLSPSASNTYVTEQWKRAKAIAADAGYEMTQFDSAFEVAKQQQQLQNVIASGKYDGVIISAPLGEALTPDVQRASEAGLKVAVVGAPLGPDLKTADPQVEGVDLSVLTPPYEFGVQLGEMALLACETKDPCRVVYFYGVKGTPFDNAYYEGFTDTIAENDAIEIVAEGEGKYQGPDVALAEMQNIMQSTPEFDVVVGADQSMQGVKLALEPAGKLKDVSIIGLGGSEVGIKAIRAAEWFGGVVNVPQTEGELVIEGMLQLLEDGQLDGPSGIDPIKEISNVLITSDNADQIEPEWKG